MYGADYTKKNQKNKQNKKNKTEERILSVF